MNCILCDISSGQALASFVYDDEDVFGIMSLDQPNPYKVLVITRAHIETIFDYLTGKLLAASKQRLKSPAPGA
jgi:diadenosine tetraphosphate (Ap4A) HIT family hydrolase